MEPTQNSLGSRQLSRRNFHRQSALALCASPWLLSLAGQNARGDQANSLPVTESGLVPNSRAANVDDVSLKGRIFKTLKVNMTGGIEGDLIEKFKGAQGAGFDGIEMDSPGMNVAETLRAIDATGLPVDGTVCSTHWSVKHTDPDPEVRKRALADLELAIRDTNAVGGKTVLLVAGHGKDGSKEEIWQRAVENISKALPLAAKHGIVIAIENVWNHFMYDHDGDAQQTAAEFVRFIDEFNSPLVGMQFDIGNHWKYGSMGDWIRQLGRRIVKLDLKGYSRATESWADIGEGDIDWRDVRASLAEINFHGWAAAEVGGGDAKRLALIASQMDRVLNLS